MLDISKPLTSGKVQSYYRAEYSSASNSYFTEGGALRGEWHGRLTPTLKLSGEVTATAFDRLAEGQHPETGEQLIKHRDTIKTQAGEELGHRAGWDLTFNAPKSISLTALVGGDEHLRAAHRNAVRAALDATEKYVQARIGGNNPAETTGRWIAATFEHDTARPVDGYPAPHLHTHVVVFNMTEDRFGQARSLQPYELFKIQSMSTAVYQNQLEYELRQLGYQIQRGKNHAPEVKGYSPEYLQAESQRSAEIRRSMEEKGIGGREAADHVAHQGREEKLKLTPEELRAAHQRSAAEFGNQPQRVVNEAGQCHVRALSAEKSLERSQAAVSFARERLSERSAVFDHFEVIRDALRHTHGLARLQDVEVEVDRQRNAERFLQVHHVRPNAPAARYTTPELIQVERETIERVRAGQNATRPVEDVSVGSVMSRCGSLNEDQRRVVYEALTSKNQIVGIQGGAGTGKTTALRAVRDFAEEHGYKTQGLGPTSRAAKELRNAGIESETLQAYLTRGQAPTPDQRPRLFFVDESSLTSGRQMRDFLQTLQPQDRVLLIGDTRQHQSVEAGRIFGELQDVGMQTIRLEKIVRQKDEGLRQVVEAMAAGRIVDGVQLLSKQNRIHSIEHRSERLAAIARGYAASPEGTLVISPDNRSRKDLNAAIRDELRETGQLQPDVYRMRILVNRQDVTGEDRGVVSSYHVGDSIRYQRGSEALGLAAKAYATVIDTDSEKNLITVKRADDGKEITYNPERLRGVAIYEPEMRALAEGDRIQFTNPWKERGISNRDVGTVTYVDGEGNIRVQLDDSGRIEGWNLKTNQHIDYAYAMTSHSSQGATVDQVFIHVDTSDSKSRALIDETLAYVATSRPRYDAQVFTDNESELATALSRRHENTTALAPEEVESYSMAI